ncbi:hypothetical protein C7M84_019112 [Penaeus vannamei]|uniref:Uncharacterized protein n=1 Tax=Penaeus vannamei TaxID=6689 RepID=A0A423SFV3_PENVA|nr:hypothetical protein C7M84_019112 [Penaeus vannamei]
MSLSSLSQLFPNYPPPPCSFGLGAFPLSVLLLHQYTVHHRYFHLLLCSPPPPFSLHFALLSTLHHLLLFFIFDPLSIILHPPPITFHPPPTIFHPSFLLPPPLHLITLRHSLLIILHHASSILHLHPASLPLHPPSTPPFATDLTPIPFLPPTTLHPPPLTPPPPTPPPLSTPPTPPPSNHLSHLTLPHLHHTPCTHHRSTSTTHHTLHRSTSTLPPPLPLHTTLTTLHCSTRPSPTTSSTTLHIFHHTVHWSWVPLINVVPRKGLDIFRPSPCLACKCIKSIKPKQVRTAIAPSRIRIPSRQDHFPPLSISSPFINPLVSRVAPSVGRVCRPSGQCNATKQPGGEAVAHSICTSPGCQSRSFSVPVACALRDLLHPPPFLLILWPASSVPASFPFHLFPPPLRSQAPASLFLISSLDPACASSAPPLSPLLVPSLPLIPSPPRSSSPRPLSTSPSSTSLSFLRLSRVHLATPALPPPLQRPAPPQLFFPLPSNVPYSTPSHLLSPLTSASPPSLPSPPLLSFQKLSFTTLKLA